MAQTNKVNTSFESAMQFIELLLIWRLKNPSLDFKNAPALKVDTLADSFLKKIIKW